MPDEPFVSEPDITQPGESVLGRGHAGSDPGGASWHNWPYWYVQLCQLAPATRLCMFRGSLNRNLSSRNEYCCSPHLAFGLEASIVLYHQSVIMPSSLTSTLDNRASRPSDSSLYE